jgi:hypothetical protein
MSLEPKVIDDSRTDYVTRESILKLLSDDEIARVSTAETAARLVDDDQYLDLERLDRGVLYAGDEATRMDHVLPRKAVHADTWNRILTRLAAARVRV